MVDISSLYQGRAFVPSAAPPPPSGEPERTIYDFENEAREAGLTFPPTEAHPILDGAIHRVPTRDDKGGDRSGWYVLHETDGVTFGSYGDWRSQMTVSWCSREASRLTFAEQEAIQERQREAERRAEEARRWAAERAETVVERAGEASPDHPYLRAKGVQPHGIGQEGDTLVIPAMNADGEVTSYQTIRPDGSKLFLKGGLKKGTFYWVDGAQDGPLYVAEGFATGATLQEVTGQPCAVAWDAGNLEPVVAALRACTSRPIIVAADNDQWKPEKGNPGVEKATWAARTHPNVTVAVPRFRDTDGKPTDWNDLARSEGLHTVRKQLWGDDAPLIAQGWACLEEAALPPRQWLYGRHAIRGYVSVTLSPGGVGKTTLALIDAIALATGRTLVHNGVWERVKAWHFNLEDPLDELQRRVLAIVRHFGVDQRELVGNLFLNSGRDRPLIVAEGTPAGDVIMRPDVEALETAIRENGIGYVSVDPFIRSHRVNENSNKEVDEVADLFAKIADRTGCSFDLVHHVSKGSRPGDMDAARGASALASAARAGRTLAVMSEDDANHLGIKLENRRDYVRTDDAKGNMAPVGKSAAWFKRVSVQLNNGDNVGVMEKWNPPGMFSDVSTEQIRALQAALRLPAGQEPVWREDYRSNDWVGHVVAEHLELDPQEDRKRIENMVREWIKTGVLAVTKAEDHRRRERSYVVAGPTEM